MGRIGRGVLGDVPPGVRAAPRCVRRHPRRGRGRGQRGPVPRRRLRHRSNHPRAGDPGSERIGPGPRPVGSDAQGGREVRRAVGPGQPRVRPGRCTGLSLRPVLLRRGREPDGKHVLRRPDGSLREHRARVAPGRSPRPHGVAGGRRQRVDHPHRRGAGRARVRGRAGRARRLRTWPVLPGRSRALRIAGPKRRLRRHRRGPARHPPGVRIRRRGSGIPRDLDRRRPRRRRPHAGLSLDSPPADGARHLPRCGAGVCHVARHARGARARRSPEPTVRPRGGRS